MKTFNAVIKENFNVRNNQDQRKKENNIIISYKDEKGIEYRKKYSFPVNTSFDNMINSIPKAIN